MHKYTTGTDDILIYFRKIIDETNLIRYRRTKSIFHKFLFSNFRFYSRRKYKHIKTIYELRKKAINKILNMNITIDTLYLINSILNMILVYDIKKEDIDNYTNTKISFNIINYKDADCYVYDIIRKNNFISINKNYTYNTDILEIRYNNIIKNVEYYKGNFSLISEQISKDCINEKEKNIGIFIKTFLLDLVYLYYDNYITARRKKDIDLWKLDLKKII